MLEFAGFSPALDIFSDSTQSIVPLHASLDNSVALGSAVTALVYDTQEELLWCGTSQVCVSHYHRHTAFVRAVLSAFSSRKTKHTALSKLTNATRL